MNQKSQDNYETQVQVQIGITALDHSRKCSNQVLHPLVDTRVHMMIICGWDWRLMKNADPGLRPKILKVKFTPYGTNSKLDMIGQTKAVIWNNAGGQVDTMVYIAKGGGLSLLGLKDVKALGIMCFKKDEDGNGEEAPDFQ